MVYHRARCYDTELTIFQLPNSHYTRVSTTDRYYHTWQIRILNQRHKAHLNTIFTQTLRNYYILLIFQLLTTQSRALLNIISLTYFIYTISCISQHRLSYL
jgi:hypothetical protein